MRSETISVNRENLDYIFNLVSSMRNELILKDEEDQKRYLKERQEEPVIYGYLATYQKQDGSIFQKRTKHRPFDYSFHKDYQVGDINQFGHKLISIVEDRQLNLGLSDVDINRKWYV